MPDTDTYGWEIVDISHNGEFLSFATLVYMKNGRETHRETFTYSSEDHGPIYSATELARSAALSWYESMTTTLEERLGPYGSEWEREQEERQAWSNW